LPSSSFAPFDLARIALLRVLIRILVRNGLDSPSAGRVDFRLGPDESAQLHSIVKRNQAGDVIDHVRGLSVRIAHVKQMFLDALIKHKE
jgi:hypothetical protein